MSLFLSYAHEDSDTAREIAIRLEERQYHVYRWENPGQRGGQFVEQIETEINRADGFLALVSPSYLNSSWCRRERALALIRENDLQASRPASRFVHVLKIRPTPFSEAGMLRGYDWHDCTDPDDNGMSQLLHVLDSQMRANGAAAAGRPGASGALSTPAPPTGPALSTFRNRDVELDRLIRGVTTPGGTCFWLIVAPPQLGKSWLLDQMVARLADGSNEIPVNNAVLTAPESTAWRVQLVDVREQPADVRSDVSLLLGQLFPSADERPAEARGPREISRMIGGGRQPYACLLDGAELLDRATAVQLREQLSQINQRLQDSGHRSARLAVVVAGRREEEWRGVIPKPRLSQLTLTQFGSDIVTQALHDLAEQMGRRFSTRELAEGAEHVRRFTEGLPALLVQCLLWIRQEHWSDLRDLDSAELFAEIATPYVEQTLLSVDSLLPEGGRDLGAAREALRQALRVLTPYRVLTQSHLAHHWRTDPGFQRLVAGHGWSPEDLWNAMGRTALLSRPLNEPWQAIHPPIRRLLFRYFHPTDTERASVHRRAAAFVEQWVDKQRGKELAVGIIERLWHEATAGSLDRPQDLETDLCAVAERLRGLLQPSPAYSVVELVDFVAEQMVDDEEFQEAVGRASGLPDRLLAILSS